VIGSSKAKASLEGAVDLHVHIAPSVRPRQFDGRELVEEAQKYGMRAVLLKDHDRTTVADAFLTNKLGTGVEAAGSVCLNAPNGGLNPAAAEANIKLGTRAVYFPTDSAANDGHYWARHLDPGEEKSHSTGEGARKFTAQLGVLDASGALVQEALDIISVCAAGGALVCTGHLSTDEVTAVVDECGRQGARVSVTHAPSFTEASPDHLAKWAAAGAYLELVAVFCCGGNHLPTSLKRSYAMDAGLIDAIGASAFTLSSDLGLIGSPSPPEGLATFIDGLMGEGISQADIEIMTRVNPARALGLEVLA
jgi:hypothetical protein